MNGFESQSSEAEHVIQIPKCWGKTCRVVRGHDWDIHSLHVVSGGYCSRHVHDRKWNLFYVISGTIVVEQFDNGETLQPANSSIVGPDQKFIVPSGVWHRFRVLKSGIVIEVYWPAAWNADEIIRADHGGEKWIDAGE